MPTDFAGPEIRQLDLSTKAPIVNPLLDAVSRLRLAGNIIEPASDIPGLFIFNGREVTTNQLLFIAANPIS